MGKAYAAYMPFIFLLFGLFLREAREGESVIQQASHTIACCRVLNIIPAIVLAPVKSICDYLLAEQEFPSAC